VLVFWKSGSQFGFLVGDALGDQFDDTAFGVITEY
jgi:hypothetical protein